MNIRRAAGVAALVVTAAALARPVAAADTVRLALPVVSLTVSPTYIADELGYWRDAGLDMKFPYIAGVGSNNALEAGSVEFAYTSGPTMIRGNGRGDKSVAIATTLDRIQLGIVLSKKAAAEAHVTESSSIVDKARALKGRTIAVDSFNSVVHSYVRYLARKGGIDPDRDIKITNQTGPVMLASLKKGAIDGFALSLPWPLIPVHDGTAITLVSSPKGDFPELYPFTYIAVVARPGWCDAHVSICKRVVAGFAKALTFIREHPAQSIAILKKRIPSKIAPEVFQEAFDLMRDSTPKSPRVDEAALARAQDYMIATGMMKASEKLPSLAAVYTNKFQAN